MGHLKNSACFIEKEHDGKRVTIRRYSTLDPDNDPEWPMSLVVRTYRYIQDIGYLPEKSFSEVIDCQGCKHRLVCLLNPTAEVRYQPKARTE